MNDLLRDLRHGLRILWQAKGFTLLATASLALGIGFNTTIFSAVDALLLRPKAGYDLDSLVNVYLSDSSGYPYAASSYPDYRDYRDRTDVFSGIASYQTTLTRYEENGVNEYLIGEAVSGNFFRVLGIRALLGRTLEPEDDVSPGAHPVVVVSESFWRGRLGGRSEALGGVLRLNGRPYTVVGVLPSEFGGGIPGIGMQFWGPSSMIDHLLPIARDGVSRLERRTSRSLMIKARLLPGTTLAKAQSQMDSVIAALRSEYPEEYRDRAVHLLPSNEVRIHPFVDSALFSAASLLMAVVALVLLIACANVANMLLARATARRSEVALRLALGSSRSRLVRQLLTESVLLSSVGGALGIGVAYVGTKLLLSFKPPIPVPLALDLTLNHRVLLFTVLVSVATGILFGVAPALQSSRPNLIPALKSEQGLAAPGGSRISLGNILVVVQVALSLVLLIGAALLLRSAANAQAIDPGFETERIVMASSHLGLHGYDEARGRTFYRSAVERIAALPGVESASLTDKVPLGASVQTETVAAEGREPERPADWPEIDSAVVSPGYFRTMGVPLIQGRDFAPGDDEDSPDVAIVNETAARRLWPAETPLGKRVARGPGSKPKYAEVVAVVRDTKVRTPGEDARPHVYFPFEQNYSPMMYVLARTRQAPETALETVRRELLSMEPSLAFFESGTMRQNLAITLFPVRMGAVLLGVFGGLALLLAAVGLYGVVSYSVSRRTREIGIRMAMGASGWDVEAFVTRQGAAVVLVGVGLGWAAAFFGTRALSSVLYGIASTDVVTFAGTAGILLVVALAANWIPARRAARIHPSTALHYE
jgi:putative ABC transport system permease protein